MILVGRAAPAVAAGITILTGWEILVRAFEVSPLILPGPFAVAGTIYDLHSYILSHTVVTLAEALLGFLIGLFLALAMTLAFVLSSLTRSALYPYVIAFRAIPIVAMAPLMVLWFGTGLTSKVLLAATIAFFPILVNLLSGIASIRPEAYELMATLCASRVQTLLHLEIPASVPALIAGLKLGASFAVVGAIVAEFTGASRGLGFVLKSAMHYSRTDVMFAGIFAASLLGLLLYGSVASLELVIRRLRLGENV